MSAGAADLDDLLDTDSLIGAVPEEEKPFMPMDSPRSLPEKGALARVVDRILEKAEEELRSVCRTAGILLTVSMTCALFGALHAGERAGRYVILAGVAAVGAAAMSDLDSILQMGLHSLQQMSDYSRVLLPVLTTAASAAGSLTAAGAKYAVTTVAMDMLLSLAGSVVLPCVGGYAALSLANAAVGNDILKAAKRLAKWVCVTLTSALAMGFTAWLSLTGVVTGTADTLAAKMTKTAVSAALPVVGGILSDAAGALSAAAGTVRSTVGVFGLLAVLGICLAGMIPLMIRYLVYKLAAAVCSCVADKRMGELIGDLGACFSLVLALNGTGGLILFVSVYSLMKTVVQ